MELATCKNCKRMFNSVIKTEYCPACFKKLDDKLIQARDYLLEHPDASAMDVMQEVNVDQYVMTKWINEELLHLNDDTSILDCDKCEASGFHNATCKVCKRRERSVSGFLQNMQRYNNALEAGKE